MIQMTARMLNHDHSDDAFLSEDGALLQFLV